MRATVDASLAQSCEALGTDQLDTLLLHRVHHHDSWGGAVWERLLELCDQGKIAALGVSVYEPQDALRLLQDPNVKHIQIPMNLLDWRWRASQIQETLTRRPDVVVHARSAFLQGLLVNAAEYWPACGDFDAASCIRRLQELVRMFERRSIADLCLAYVRAQSWIASVVVGCETFSQLQQNLELFRLSKLTQEECREVNRCLPIAPEVLLNPSRWGSHSERSAVGRG